MNYNQAPKLEFNYKKIKCLIMKEMTTSINLSETFLKACDENDLQKVRACLELGVDVNTKDKYNAGLHYAASNNNIELCEILLSQHGIDVNQVNSDGQTALMVSCLNEREEITQKLVSHPGIDFNCQDRDGFTAAYYAVDSGNIGCVKILSMQNNVNWNLFPPNRQTITALAIERNNQEILRMLINISSINWNLRGGDEHSALTLALKSGKTDCIKILFTVPTLEIDIDHLKRLGVYEAAIDACQQHFIEKMGGANKELVKLLNSVNKPECPV